MSPVRPVADEKGDDLGTRGVRGGEAVMDKEAEATGERERVRERGRGRPAKRSADAGKKPADAEKMPADAEKKPANAEKRPAEARADKMLRENQKGIETERRGGGGGGGGGGSLVRGALDAASARDWCVSICVCSICV
jgi:hypothetical protein